MLFAQKSFSKNNFVTTVIYLNGIINFCLKARANKGSEKKGEKRKKKKKRIRGVTRKDNRRICTTDYLINLREHLFRETRFAMKM